MKIATWNIERLKHLSGLADQQQLLDGLKADILVLTETHNRLELKNYRYVVHSPLLTEIAPGFYDAAENRVSIYTNYEIVRMHNTYDKYTTLCAELKTKYGNLLVYGTIIGIYGNRHKNFQSNLEQQISDYKRLSALGSFCLAGDFNISFADNYYFTNNGRDALLTAFDTCKLQLLTRQQPECIDHIAVSKTLFSAVKPEIKEWNQDLKLSDHKGISVEW